MRVQEALTTDRDKSRGPDRCLASIEVLLISMLLFDVLYEDHCLIFDFTLLANFPLADQLTKSGKGTVHG